MINDKGGDPLRQALDSNLQRFGAFRSDNPVVRKIQEAKDILRLAEGSSTLEAIAKRHPVVREATRLFQSTQPSAQTPVTTAADLAPLIRAARKRMKMSQQDFADAVGVGRRFLSELENGKPSLEFDKVLKCALGAGIDLSAKPRIPL